MITEEHVWKCVKMYENVWKCMKMYENVWKCMKIMKKIWNSMKFMNFDQIITISLFFGFCRILEMQFEVFAHSEILTLDYISEVIDEVRCA